MSSRDLHIALCTDGVFPHAMGGMQRHSRLLAEHLARLPGIRLTVIHPHREKVFDPELGIDEQPVAGLDHRRLYLRELWRYSGRVARKLDEVKPDAVLSQGFSVWQGMRRFTPKLIVMPHGLEMFQGLTMKDRLIGLPFRWLVRHVARRSARVVSLGGKLTLMLEGLVHGSMARVAVVPNAVQLPDDAPPYPADGDDLSFLFVGRFAFNKGIDLLLNVARELQASRVPVRFILAGDGPERARMERDGLPSNVTLAGKVDDQQLERLYADCHALVLPTRFEGMPTVVLEAMARARPVVVSDVGASAELVDGANGMLIRPGDEAALLAAIKRLAGLPNAERTAMGFAGRRRVAERFTWPRVAASILGIVEELRFRASAAG
ncbi:MAG: glycosyltransferase family 4 protein [Flavobacteriales bacterium]|jgi:glycosyltransferase involved in cell wall biosynthesis|nr:glycosyltransferase family 4 protein [Flavobacteriales bacterium]